MTTRLVLGAGVALATLLSPLHGQCPDYSNGPASAGIGKATGGEEARLVYVDCLSSIAFIEAQFGRAGLTVPLDGQPLTLAVYDDPNDDKNPNDAVPVAIIPVPGGVTGAHTGQWQRYDLFALHNAIVPATGGMFVAVGVQYPSGGGPASIQFNNNAFPQAQWLATDIGGTLNYTSLASNRLLDVSTGPGFPPGTWLVRVESGAEYRPFGQGCAGSNGTPALAGQVGTRPALAQPLILAATNLPNPAAPAAMLVGASRLSTPLALAAIGMPGCTAYVDVRLSFPLTVTSGAGTWGAVVPNDQSLLGRSLFTQVLAVDAAANALGATTSDAVQVVIGR